VNVKIHANQLARHLAQLLTKNARNKDLSGVNHRLFVCKMIEKFKTIADFILEGLNVTVGHGAILHSCHIKSGSLIGMGATILDGAVIGKNCLIGANALVTQHTIIPDGSLVVGSPAKVRRTLSEEEINGIHNNTDEYIKLIREYSE
jgi:carbonic anhydrase/acetyltransferase-like protein (isoleucine patch superfamily)